MKIRKSQSKSLISESSTKESEFCQLALANLQNGTVPSDAAFRRDGNMENEVMRGNLPEYSG